MKPPSHASGHVLRGTRSVALALLLAVARTLSAAPALPPADESLTFSRRDQVFDGIRLEAVEFRSGSLRFFTDTLGAWSVIEDPHNSRSIQLRHRVAPGVVLELHLVDRSRAPHSDRSWKDFVASALADDRRLPSLLVDGDSTLDSETPSILGLRTRQLALRYPASLESPARIERHLLAFDERIALAFVLRAPPEVQRRAFADLDFFVARLERR
ncbi:hypothetical protein ASA1KI_00200 [Opitutales bacterium ASA1]|uniref:hypothetical protein n=1 Tax=Congregicoccus parvus TaxID=3081749 RepID=UPI002B2A0020|nr:hypothetical protein ASA1KI_00200 [Opitutales bacterium ASA1]